VSSVLSAAPVAIAPARGPRPFDCFRVGLPSV